MKRAIANLAIDLIDDRGRLAKALVIVAFFIIIFLPGAQMVMGLAPMAAVPENRRLAEWPVYSAQKDLLSYIEAGQSWFNDHFGLRPFFIRLNAQINYSLFDYSSRIHIGKDGWLFYRSVYDVERPNISNILARSEDKAVAGAVELNRMLAQRGITLVLMIPALKGHFYSQYFPRSLQPLPKPTQISEFRRRLLHTKGLLFVDTDSLLREVAKRRPVFHKTDFHWNDPAAFAVAEWIVEELSRRATRKTSVWTHKLKIARREVSLGQAMFMPLFSPPREMALFVDPTWKEPLPPARTDVPPFELVSHVSPPFANVLAPVAVLGDSFFDGMLRSGITLEFEKVYRASWNRVRLQEFLAKLPPDCRYVIIEFIEVSVAGISDLADLAPNK